MSPLIGLTLNFAAEEMCAVLMRVKVRYLSESGSEAVRVKMVVPGAVFSPTSTSYVGWENTGRLSLTSRTRTTSWWEEGACYDRICVCCLCVLPSYILSTVYRLWLQWCFLWFITDIVGIVMSKNYCLLFIMFKDIVCSENYNTNSHYY